MKKIVLLVLSLVLGLSTFALTGCEKADYYVGIISPEVHPALSAAEDGFKDRLTELLKMDGKTVKFDSKNATGEQSNLPTLATALAASKNQLILSIATPAALAMANACEDKPILFTAVTDAQDEEVGLVASNEQPGGNISGTSDMNPIKQQVELMQELVPGLNKIAVMYTTSEKNSEIQVKLLEKECAAKSIAVVRKGITSINDVQDTFQGMAADIQAVYLPTDNTLAKAVVAVHSANVESKKLPVICGETDMNKTCGVATYGIDYYKLGEQTADMAYKILVEGADISKMPVEYQSGEPVLTINETVAGDINFTIPDSVKAKLPA